MERLGRELGDNLFGLDVWSTFEADTRSFVATGEAVYRLRGDDPAFDLSTAVVEYARALQRGLKRALPRDWKWLCGELPHQLAPVLDVRNPGAHSHASSREAVRPVRGAILGIGCEGLLVRIARVRMRALS